MDVLRRNNVVVTGRADGPTVLLAHGFGCDQNLWRLVVPALAERSGSCCSTTSAAGGRTSSAWTPGALRAASTVTPTTCWTSVPELDLRDVVLVGHSVSAMIGVLAANREPGRFAKLVLLTPSPCYVDDGDYRGGFSRADIDELLDSLESNYLGWSAAMAPVIMGNPDRPELAEELEDELLPHRPGDRAGVRPSHVPVRQPGRSGEGHRARRW